MIPLTYTLTVGQESMLRHIETLRAKLLSSVVPLHIERAMSWNSMVLNVKSGFSLANEDVSPGNIERVIESRRSKYHEIEIFSVWNTLQTIRETMTGSPDYLEFGTYESFFSRIRLKGYKTHTATDEVFDSLKSTLSYLSPSHEHPIIKSAIIMAVLLHSGLSEKESSLFSTCAIYTMLTVHGYTCRDLYSPVFGISSDRDSFTKALQSITRSGNLNHWILFICSRIELSLTEALESVIQSDVSAIPNIKKYSQLSDRQKTILQILEKPGMTVRNSFIQRRFGISQLTASRDLSHLTKLGLISPHGKSRSISYTRIG